MKAAMRAAVERYYRPLPPERLGWLRIVVFGYSLLYVLLQARMFLDAAGFPPEEYRPVGIFSLLETQLSGHALEALLIAFAATGTMALAGWRFTVTGPAFAVLNLVLLSYRNSWGYIQHGEKLAALHVLILASSRAGDAVSIDARARSGDAAASPESYGWPVRLMAVVTALSYVISAVTKLRYSGVQWITSDIVRNAVGWVALRNEVLGLPSSPLGPLLLQVSWVFNAIAVFTLIVELGAPLAFFRTLRTPWILAAVMMHWGILALMLIPFPYHLLGIPFLPFVAMERRFAQSSERVSLIARRRPFRWKLDHGD